MDIQPLDLSNQVNTLPSTHFNVDLNDPSTPLYNTIDDIKANLPVQKWYSHRIFTKVQYPYIINPHNEHHKPADKQTRSLSSKPANYPFPDDVYTSAYGPVQFDWETTPSFPRADHWLNGTESTDPSQTGQYARSFALAAMRYVTQFGLDHNHVRIYNNNNLISRVVSDPNRPVITYANHNTTIDDPFIIVAVEPDINSTNSRWVLCGQDICYPTGPIGTCFIAGRVMPVQRGSGLYQSHFTRMHHLLSRNHWVHIFPEGKVQFTPNYDGLDHTPADPPRELSSFKWGIGALVAESILRGEQPAIIPIAHTSARVHGKGSGIPDFNRNAVIVAGDDVYNDIYDIVQQYTNHVHLYEIKRTLYEPKKEDLYKEITSLLKHRLDMLYTYSEYNDIDHTTGKWNTYNSHDNHPIHGINTHNTTIQKKALCSPQTCYCCHDQGFTIRTLMDKHARLAHSIQSDHTRWENVIPWYARVKLPLSREAAAAARAQSLSVQHDDSILGNAITSLQQQQQQQQATQQQPQASQPSPLGTLLPLESFYLSWMNAQQLQSIPVFPPTPTPAPILRQQSSSTTTTPSPHHTIPAGSIPFESPAPSSPTTSTATTTTPSSSIPLHRLGSTHDIPRLYRVKTRKLVHQWNYEASVQHMLSNALPLLKRRWQWGTGKYKLGLDGYYPDIFAKDNGEIGNTTTTTNNNNNNISTLSSLSHSGWKQRSTELNTSTSNDQTHVNDNDNNNYDNEDDDHPHKPDIAHPFDWFTIWKSRHVPVKSSYFEYVPHDHGIIIPYKAFDETWEQYMSLDINTYMSQQYNKDNWQHSDVGYALEVFALRNRLNYMKNTYPTTFDWNGTAI